MFLQFEIKKTCLWQFTLSAVIRSSPTNNSGLWEFPLTPVINCNMWNVLRTLNWLCHVDRSLNLAKSNSHLLTFNEIWGLSHNFSYLITSLVYSVYWDICINTCVISMYIQFNLTCTACDTTRNIFYNCTYIHLYLFHLKLSNIQQSRSHFRFSFKVAFQRIE